MLLSSERFSLHKWHISPLSMTQILQQIMVRYCYVPCWSFLRKSFHNFEDLTLEWSPWWRIPLYLDFFGKFNKNRKPTSFMLVSASNLRYLRIIFGSPRLFKDSFNGNINHKCFYWNLSLIIFPYLAFSSRH